MAIGGISRWFLVAVVALAAALGPIVRRQAAAANPPKPAGPRCCFRVSIAALGSYQVDYGTAPGTYYNGTFAFNWQWSASLIVQYQDSTSPSLQVLGRTEADGKLVEANAISVPDGASTATPPPHLPDSCQPSSVDLGGFHSRGVGLELSSATGLRDVKLVLADPLGVPLCGPKVVSPFTAGLQGPWTYYIKAPELRQFRSGTNFAQVCYQRISHSVSASQPAWNGTNALSVSFTYFPKANLHLALTKLASLQGTHASLPSTVTSPPSWLSGSATRSTC